MFDETDDGFLYCFPWEIGADLLEKDFSDVYDRSFLFPGNLLS